MSQEVPKEPEEEKQWSQELSEKLDKITEELGLDKIVMVASKDTDPGHVMIWHRGDRVEVAEMAAGFARMVKTEILSKLEV
jgi:hypothetical protein